MKTSYVYLLRSIKDGKFYVGWTTDLKRRLEEHNAGLTRSTKSRTPFELIGYETYSSSELAKKRERTLKHCPRMLSLFKKRTLKKFETPPQPSNKRRLPTASGGVSNLK